MPNDFPIIDSHVSLGQEHHLALDTPALLAQMDCHNLATSIARPMGSELVVHNRRGNDRVLSAGPRIRGLATVNPWTDRDQALCELSRCRAAGAVGLYLHPTRQGFMPTDPLVEPLLDIAAEARWPVVLHTGTYINSDVLAVAETARRRPELTFVCDCAGFTDMWFELPGLMERTSNIVLCSSLIWARAILVTVKNHGADRVLFGSGHPRDSIEAALRRIDRLDLTPDDRRAILHDNACRIFALP